MEEWVSDSWTFSWALSLGWVALSNFDVMVLFSSYYILFCYDPLEACSLLMRRKKGSGSGWEGSGEKLGGVEGGETVIGIYCMRKESIFNKRKNKNYKKNARLRYLNLLNRKTHFLIKLSSASLLGSSATYISKLCLNIPY